MKPFKTNRTEGIALTLPMDAYDVQMGHIFGQGALAYRIGDFLNLKGLPEAEYAPPIKLSEITEAEAGGIVDKAGMFWRGYQYKALEDTATSSVHSLIRSLGLDPSDNIYLITKGKAAV